MANTLPAADTQKDDSVETERLRRWQRITLLLLFIGYAGYYACRVNLSVATPLLIKAFAAQGLDKARMGWIVTVGSGFYAAGKFINGSLVDFLGGKRMFLFGMIGAMLFTLGFGLSAAVPIFTLAWGLNRLALSTGWAGMVRISSRWFSYSSYGSVMGILSLSFLVGETFWKLVYGQLLHNGMDWRGLFYVAAAGLGAIFVVNLLLLKESPRAIGEPEPPTNPANLFGDGKEQAQTSLIELLKPLVLSPMFWAVCALSFGFTLIREAFGAWTPQYLTEVTGMKEDAAASASAFFPFCGAISTLLCGFFGDRLGSNGRATLILIGLVVAVPTLLALGNVGVGHHQTITLLLLGAIAFCILGPYTFLAGAIALDFGGKTGSATASGWIDGVGYLAGLFAGEGIGALAQHTGWGSAFGALAGITGGSAVAAVIYWFMQRNASLRRNLLRTL